MISRITTGHLTMSSCELDRLQILVRVSEKRLTQREAASILGLTQRQVRRLVRAHREHGDEGLVSKKRGRPSNRKLADATRETTLTLVQARYADFGPTFAHEKLSAMRSRPSTTSRRAAPTRVDTESRCP